MKYLFGGLLILCCLAGGGCKALYEGFKMSRNEDCYRLTYPEQEECLRQVDISYEEYEKERRTAQMPILSE